MKVYFMDLEFLCDEDYAYEDEIIAICLLAEDESYELTSLVRPYGDDFEVSEYCTNLTGISKEDLVSKPLFSDLLFIKLNYHIDADKLSL